MEVCPIILAMLSMDIPALKLIVSNVCLAICLCGWYLLRGRGRR